MYVVGWTDPVAQGRLPLPLVAIELCPLLEHVRIEQCRIRFRPALMGRLDDVHTFGRPGSLG